MAVCSDANVLTFLWFTAANFFAFSLSFGLRDYTGIDPPDQWKYGYGIGKETFLTPAPWIYIILLLVHVSFGCAVVFSRWTDRGKDIFAGALNYRWPLLMVLSIFWTATWLRQWYILSWIFALIVAVLADHTDRILKRRYRLEYELNFNDEVFIHLPFSLFRGWTTFLFAINTFAAFSPISLTASLAFKVIAVWILAILSGLAHLAAFSTRSGDIPMTLILALGQFAIFAHQINRKDTNSQHLIAWFAFGFGFVSVWALAKSVWGTIDVVRHGAGAMRLEDEEERERGD